MANNPGIARRLGRDLKLQALYISIAALVGVFAAALLLENVLIKQALRGEAQYYWQQVADNGDRPLPDTRNMIGYRDGIGDGIPPQLQGLGLGFHNQSNPDAVAYVTEQQGQRLYLVFESGQVGELIALFGLLPLVFVLIVVYLALYSAYRVSQRAVSPVIALAQRVQQLDPAAPDATLFSDSRAATDADEEVRVLAAAMENLTERLAAFAERERHFTRDASHELRSPLTVIKMATSLLIQSSSLDANGMKSVQRIRQSANDMEELTDAFLLLARESGDTLRQDVVDVNQVVAGEVERASLLASNKNISIAFEAHAHFSVVAPEKVIASMVGNLLRNGVNYTDAGTVSVTIRSGTVTIADTGPGMAPDEVERVFQAFYRGDKRRGGHGVGLTIVRRLSERFGWPVTVESELGRGTTVTITFTDSQPISEISHDLHTT
ncbi:MAG: HAMP domain-containing sensor histidine kinase [Pseudomonadota bacterium]